MTTDSQLRLQRILQNALDERERHGREQRQLRRFVDDTADAIANALRNDLTVVAGNIELIEMRHLSDAVHRFADNAQVAAKSASRTLERVSLLGSIGRERNKVMDVHQEIGRLRRSLDKQIRTDIRVVWTSNPGRFSMQADPDEFRLILRELLQNALDALPTGGTVEIDSREVRLASPSDSSETSWWHAIEIIDNAQGLPEPRNRTFHPPTVTTDGRKKLALGLSLLDRFVLSQNGAYDIETSGAGTTITMLVPLEGTVPSELHV